MTIDEQISADSAKRYAESLGVPPVTAPTEPIVVTPPVEPPVAEPPVELPPVTPPAEPPVTPPVDIPPTKSFEDYLAEKSEGKYKTWEELQASLTPKELKFANDKIKHFNDLAEKGIDVTSREFLELQGLDFEKMNKAEDVLFEKWKRSEDGEGLSETTIRNDINKKYNVEEWIEKDPSEYTADDVANREKMARDSDRAKGWLTNYKNERVLEKQVDPSIAEALARENDTQLGNWDRFVDTDLVNKITKLSSPISYKDETGKTVESSFVYEFPKESVTQTGSLMKQLPRDSNAFFSQFKDDKGNPNHEALALMKLKADNFDKAVAASYSAGAEQRALQIEKSDKNTDFKPAESVSKGQVFTTIGEAQANAVATADAKQFY